MFKVAQHTETHRLKMLDGLALQLRHSVQRFHREATLDEEDDAAMLAAFRKITAFATYVFFFDFMACEREEVPLNCGKGAKLGHDPFELKLNSTVYKKMKMFI